MQATLQEAVREWTQNAGADRTDECWLLSNYDTWERNPCYEGPEQPHPESETFDPDFHAPTAAQDTEVFWIDWESHLNDEGWA